jgi:hypothetical protein
VAITRLAVSAVALLALGEGTVFTAARDGRHFFRVRSVDNVLVTCIQDAYGRAPTFRRLVDRIEQSDVIVYIENGGCPAGNPRACLKHVVVKSRSNRFLRIAVDKRRSMAWLAALLGHELQHVIEVAEAVDVDEDREIEALFRRIGDLPCANGRGDCFETSRAVAVGAAVLEEMRRSSVR